MIALKFLSVILAQWTLLQGGYCLNETGNAGLNATKPQILETLNGPTTLGIVTNDTQSNHRSNETSAQNGKPPQNITEILEIFHNATFDTSILNCTNVTSGNFTFYELTSNETNYSTVAKAIASSESIGPSFRLQKSAVIPAGVFLVSAVIGYLSCVGYRRYLQRKYGESQMISREDVYDTSDLRYFEI